MEDIKITQKCLDKSGPREEKDNQWHIQLPKDKANTREFSGLGG